MKRTIKEKATIVGRSALLLWVPLTLSDPKVRGTGVWLVYRDELVHRYKGRCRKGKRFPGLARQRSNSGHGCILISGYWLDSLRWKLILGMYRRFSNSRSDEISLVRFRTLWRDLRIRFLVQKRLVR